MNIPVIRDVNLKLSDESRNKLNCFRRNYPYRKNKKSEIPKERIP